MPFTTAQLKNRLEGIAERAQQDASLFGFIRVFEPTIILAYAVCLLTEQILQANQSLSAIAAAQQSIDAKTPSLP